MSIHYIKGDDEMTKVLRIEEQGKVMNITLNRPESINAINAEMMSELHETFKALQDREDIQIVVLRGEGKGFSSGGDIKEMLSNEKMSDMEGLMQTVSAIGKELYRLPQITISFIHGAAAGLGLSIALATDLIVAEKTSKIAMNFIGIGLVPDGGGHFFMKERVGTVKAKQLIWQGEVMTAEKAHALGLVDQLVDKLDESTTTAVLQKIKQAPLASMMETKRILQQSKLKELDEILALETVGQVKMRQTKDHLEGIQAFVEKRTPQFQGK